MVAIGSIRISGSDSRNFTTFEDKIDHNRLIEKYEHFKPRNREILNLDAVGAELAAEEGVEEEDVAHDVEQVQQLHHQHLQG